MDVHLHTDIPSDLWQCSVDEIGVRQVVVNFVFPFLLTLVASLLPPILYDSRGVKRHTSAQNLAPWFSKYHQSQHRYQP